MKKKILIFGGSGLIGSTFINYSKELFEIFYTYNENPKFFEHTNSNKINLLLEREKITSIINQFNPDVIYASIVEDSFPIFKRFMELIEKKLEIAREDLDQLQSSLSHKDDNSTEDTSPTFKMMEDGSETMSREETSALAGRQEKFIRNLENALLRIKNKTYGICRVTGKLIPKARLRLVPHATLSMEAKERQ